MKTQMASTQKYWMVDYDFWAVDKHDDVNS